MAAASLGRLFRSPWAEKSDGASSEVFSSISPPNAAQSAQLVKGLRLADRTLQAPHFFKTGWSAGQRFVEKDDADRMALPWQSPSFVMRKDPVQQRKKTSVQELFSNDVGDIFARVVRGVLDESDCAELIKCVNVKGFTPALLNIGGGKQQLEPTARNSHRCIVDSEDLSKWLLNVLRPYLPEVLEGGRLVDLNERLRVLCYTPGQEFGPHYDGCYTRSHEDRARAGDCSMVTVQLYLHDVPE
ncbi:unnamed protein product, partial [Effrenium voratum]